MRNLFLIVVAIGILYTAFFSKEPPKTIHEEYRTPPEPGRRVRAYDFTNHRYIYEGDGFVKTSMGYWVKEQEAPEPKPLKLNPRDKTEALGPFDIPNF